MFNLPHGTTEKKMKTSLKKLYECMRENATPTSEMWREYIAKQRAVCIALGVKEVSTTLPSGEVIKCWERDKFYENWEILVTI